MSEPVSNGLLAALFREGEVRANARSVASGGTVAAMVREIVDVRTALVGYTMPSETTAAESVTRIIGGREAALVEIGRLQAEIDRLRALVEAARDVRVYLDDHAVVGGCPLCGVDAHAEPAQHDEGTLCHVLCVALDALDHATEPAR